MTNNLFVLRHKETQLFVGRVYDCWLFILTEELADAVFFGSSTDKIVKEVCNRKEWYKHDLPTNFEFELVELSGAILSVTPFSNLAL